MDPQQAPLRLLDPNAYHDLVDRSRNNDADATAALKTTGLLKDFIPQVKVLSEEQRIIRFVISTGSVDRMGDTVAPAGWDLADFIRGGQPVLFAHNRWDPVVGRGVRTYMEPNQLVSETQFTPRELNPFGFMIFQLYAADYMRATSVGFLPLEYNYAEDRKRGINFIRQQLMEYSMVPVPANPDCLSSAKAAGVDVAPMRAWAERSLDLLRTASPADMTRETLERLRAVCDDTQIRYFIPTTEDPVDPQLLASITALEASVKAMPEAIATAVAKALTKKDPEPETPAETPAAAADAPAADAPAETPATETPAETPATDTPAGDPDPGDVSAAAPEAHVLMLDHEVELGIDVTPEEIGALLREQLQPRLTELTGRLD